MTYVLGVRRGNVVSIHADSQLSADDQFVGVASLKCGVFFPGCIFGLAGAWEDGLRFVHTVRRAVEHLQTITERWSMFEQVCSAYNPYDAGFEILLATRVSGRPSFYLYRSEKRQLTAGSGDFYALGSGATLYEGVTANFVEHALGRIERWSDYHFPYFLHALLNESLVGASGVAASAKGVGGFFTFVLQDERMEMRQRSSLLVHLTVDPQELSVVVRSHRLAFDNHSRIGEVMFYCEKPTGLPAQWHILLQNVSGHTVSEDEMRGIKAWANEVIKRDRSHHPYYFLQAKILGVVYYAPFLDFCIDEKYFADLDDYLDQDVFDSLMTIYEMGGVAGVAGSEWQLLSLPPTSGRRWSCHPRAPSLDGQCSELGSAPANDGELASGDEQT